MISFLRSDRRVNQFVKRPSIETKEKALEFIQKITTGFDNREFYYWKITERGKNVMIGSICLWNFSEDQRTAEVGYDLSPNYQEKGIMSESLKKVIEFGFRKLNLDLIEAYTHKLNLSSVKLLEGNGFNVVEKKKDPDNAENIIYELKSQQ
jgi:ribosomal-protein-alanine N-acetyltransferase